MRKHLLLLLFICTISTAQPITVAVNELSGTGITADELTILSQRLRSELIKTGSFQVMERAEMKSILQEQGFQSSGACDESTCMVEMGRLLGVKQIVAGSIGKVGADFFTVSLRMIDVQTGAISKSADYDYTGTLSGMITNGLASASALMTGKQIESSTKKSRVNEPAVIASVPVTIKTNTTNAKLTIDDSIVGKTPFSGTLLQGKHKINLSKDGFTSVRKTIFVEANTPFDTLFTIDSIVIKAIDSVAVTFITTPDKATVEIKDVLLGVTPYTGRLLPGKYFLEITKDGYKPVKNRYIKINENEPLSQDFTLDQLREPKKGRGTRIATAIIGIGAVGAGIACNEFKKQYDEDASKMYEQSKSMYEDDPSLVSLNKSYNNKLDQRKSANMWRNISYGIAGVSASLFSVSFAFGKESK